MGLFDFFKKTPEIPPAALIPMVTRQSTLRFLAKRADENDDPLTAVRELTPSFGVALALLTTRGPSPLSQADLKRTREKEQGAWVHAVKNATHLLGDLKPGKEMTVHHSEEGAAGSIIPLLAGLKKAGLDNAMVVMLPTSSHLLMAMEDDVTTLRAMFTKARELWNSDDWCSLSPLRIFDQIEDWVPPAGHPLAGEVKAMRSMTNARTVDVECALADALGKAPIAHRGVEAPEDGGRLVGAWARGTSVILCESMDAVRLVDTDDANHDDVLVDLKLLLESTPWAFEALADEESTGPGLWRTRAPSFPSVRMRGFMLSRAAWLARGGGTEPREVDAAELLKLWDAGDPVHVDALPDNQVALMAPDYRSAVTAWAPMKARVEALDAEDQATFQTGRMAVLMMAAMGGEEVANELEQLGALVRDLSENALEQRRPVVMAGAPVDPADLETEKSAREVLAKSQALLQQPTSLFPVLRPPGYDAAWQEQARGMAGDLAKTHDIKMPTPVRRPFQAGISADLVADTPNTMVPMSSENVPEGLRDTAWETALLNLRAASVGAMEELSPGTLHAAWRDGYQASRLLVPGVLTRAKVKGRHLVFVPSINRMWVTGEEDAAGMARVLDAMDAWMRSEEANHAYQWRTLLSAVPWVIHDNKVEPWKVPSGHPLAERMASMETTLLRRREASAAKANARGAETPLSPE
jgi:hypothetical protein